MYCGGGEQLQTILYTYLCSYLMSLNTDKKLKQGLGRLFKNNLGQSQNSQHSNIKEETYWLTEAWLSDGEYWQGA